MNFKRFILFSLVFILLTGQASYSFTGISVEVIEKSEDNSEERIEQFTTHQRQKLVEQRIVPSTVAAKNLATTFNVKLILALPSLASEKLYIRHCVFRN